MRFALTDEQGLKAHLQAVTFAALQIALDQGEVDSRRLSVELYRRGIGDAKSEDRYELSYSSTGAIARAGLNSLRGQGLLAYLDTPGETTFLFRGEEVRSLRVSLVLTDAGKLYARDQLRLSI